MDVRKGKWFGCWNRSWNRSWRSSGGVSEGGTHSAWNFPPGWSAAPFTGIVFVPGNGGLVFQFQFLMLSVVFVSEEKNTKNVLKQDIIPAYFLLFSNHCLQSRFGYFRGFVNLALQLFLSVLKHPIL